MKIYHEILTGMIQAREGKIQLINFNDDSIVFRLKDKNNNKALLIVEKETFVFEYKELDQRIIDCVIDLFEREERMERI